MKSFFVDTSSLIPFYYPENESDKIEKILLDADIVYISNLAVVEMASALSKKVRMGELTKPMEIDIWQTFLDDLETGQMEVLRLNERHYFKAADIVREFGDKYGIKTLDSLQLATAHGLQDSLFLCSDKVLLKLAKKIGIELAKG